MKRASFFLTLTLIVCVILAASGLAADQGVRVIVPSRALIVILTPQVTINIPSIDTWPLGAQSLTVSSQTFTILTTLNTLGNSDMVVTSTPFQSGVNGPTIPLSDIKVNLDTYPFLGGTPVTTAGTLDRVVVSNDIGAGIRWTFGRYDVTVSDTQESGRYTGTVTYTLVNN